MLNVFICIALPHQYLNFWLAQFTYHVFQKDKLNVFGQRTNLQRYAYTFSWFIWTVQNDILHPKIYDKIDDFGFPIVHCPFLDCDIVPASSYGMYISQMVRFAIKCQIWMKATSFFQRKVLIPGVSILHTSKHIY